MPYIIKTSKASMPSFIGSLNYYKTAVIEVDEGVSSVSMISERARGVRRIVETWGPSYSGKTDRCQAAKDMREATELLHELTHNS